MIHRSTLQPSELAGLFILGAIALVRHDSRGYPKRRAGSSIAPRGENRCHGAPQAKTRRWQRQKRWDASLSSPAAQSPQTELGPYPEFHQTYACARRVRADIAFAEKILDLADDASDDWSYNEKTGKLSVNNEVLSRSRVRIEARQFHMSRLHPTQWGDKQKIDLKSDWTLL